MGKESTVTPAIASEIMPTPATELPDFSLVLGGPLFQLYRRLHLSGDALELLPRRVLVVALFAWLPLLLLSVLERHGAGGAIKIPFLYDIESHARFLIALPALIIAEVVVRNRINPLARRFVDRRIVVTEDFPAFNAAVNSAMRVRDSFTVELALLVLVYTLGFWIWRSQIATGAATWYGTPDATHLHLTLAGYWYAFVSIPLFQFILLRWYMRLVIWFRFLWQVSRLNLRLTAAHPDRAGGIGFLGSSSYAFAPILFAQGALLAGWIANRVLYEGRGLLSFKMLAAGYVGFFVLCILGPLLMFTVKLDNTHRKGAAEYGLLANRYVFGFEQKWIGGGTPETSELLGTADLQSLADLANSYSVVREMRIVPFGHAEILRLAAWAAIPLLPLTLTIFSVEELLTRLIKVIF
jgi:hypothetical protein